MKPHTWVFMKYFEMNIDMSFPWSDQNDKVRQEIKTRQNHRKIDTSLVL